jgi:hypothetical protein
MADDDNIKYIEGCPDWMLTMGDCMSLLLTFFVMLMSFSPPEKSKLLDMMGGIQGALSLFDTNGFDEEHKSIYKGGDITINGESEDGDSVKVKVESHNLSPIVLNSLKIVNRFNEFKERISQIGFKKMISVERMNEGIIVTTPLKNLVFLPKKVSNKLPFFNSKGYPFLENLANLLNSAENEIRLTVFYPRKPKNASRFYWVKYRNSLFSISNVLIEKYEVDSLRFSFSCVEMKDANKEPYIQFMLVDKLKTSQITINDLVNLPKNNR